MHKTQTSKPSQKNKKIFVYKNDQNKEKKNERHTNRKRIMHTQKKKNNMLIFDSIFMV